MKRVWEPPLVVSLAHRRLTNHFPLFWGSRCSNSESNKWICIAFFICLRFDRPFKTFPARNRHNFTATTFSTKRNTISKNACFFFFTLPRGGGGGGVQQFMIMSKSLPASYSKITTTWFKKKSAFDRPAFYYRGKSIKHSSIRKRPQKKKRTTLLA